MDIDLDDAAVILGVHYQTAYRWVRQGVLPARKEMGSYRLAEDDVRSFAEARRAPQPPPCIGRVRDWAPLVDQLHAAFVEGEELRARRLFERLQGAGVPVTELCGELVGPALRRVESTVAARRRTCSEAYAAAAMSERLLARVAVAPPGRPPGRAVVCSPAGEHHRLPSLMATVALRAERWRVHHLGADVPEHVVTEVLRSRCPTVVVLSCALTGAVERAERWRDGFLRAFTVPVLIGRSGASLGDLAALARAVASEDRRLGGDAA